MIDLTTCFEAGLRTDKHRGDESSLHLGGDVAGICDRQGWYRRATDPAEAPPHETETLKLFARGHAIEEYVLENIERGLPNGYWMYRNMLCSMETPDGEEEAVGHIDAAIYEFGPGSRELARSALVAILDVKSQVWWQARDEYNRITWKPKQIRETAQLQLAAYAIAVKAPRAILFEYDVASDQVRESDVDIEGLRATVAARLVAAARDTNPESTAPPAAPLPGNEWACGSIGRSRNTNTMKFEQVVKKAYCRWTMCPNHVQNAAVEV